MANLQKTRERIKVVNNIKIITNAMQLVAASKMRRVQEHNKTHSQYHSLFMHIFDDLRSRLTQKEISAIFKDNNSDKTLYIVVTSDMGLSGSYNSNIFKITKKTLKKGDLMMVFGAKGDSYFRSDSFENDMVIDSEINIGDIIDYSHAINTARDSLNLFKQNKIGKVCVIYTEFINNLTYQETIKQILPFDKIESKNKIHQAIDFEPSEKDVLESAIPMYLASEIYHMLSVSKLSEITSRRFAMENATNNAGDLIDALTLEYNRVRQAKITQEITEIIGGTQ